MANRAAVLPSYVPLHTYRSTGKSSADSIGGAPGASWVVSLLIAWSSSTAAILFTAQFFPCFRLKARCNRALRVGTNLDLLPVLIDWLVGRFVGVGTLGLGGLLAGFTEWLIATIAL